MTKPKKQARRRRGQSDSKAMLGELPEPHLWMTHESEWRLKIGGNSKGTVPVHGKQSATRTVL